MTGVQTCALPIYNELEGQIGRMRGLETGIVRIGTFSSVAINWLPPIFSKLQNDYPGIEYEMLLGDYDEVEHWINEGRVDCGFLRLPTAAELDTIPLEQDEYKVVLPVGHPLAEKETVSIHDLNDQLFLLLEHGGKTEVSDLLERHNVRPRIRFTTWEDFAIMAMVEKDMGISILPDLILKRVPYRIEIQIGRASFDRTRDEKPEACDAGGREVYGISAVSECDGIEGSCTPFGLSKKVYNLFGRFRLTNHLVSITI